MSKTAVFLEASIGLDPDSHKTWSGVAPFLFRAMRAEGSLDRTFSLGLGRATRMRLLARTFSRDRSLWRNQYYFSPAYASAVNALARRTRYEGPIAMQIGARFSLPQAFPGKKTLSLNDGNFIGRLNAGFGMRGLSRQQIDEALRFQESVAQSHDAVCTFSEYLRESFIHDYHVDPSRVVNIGGAVNLTEFPAPSEHKNYDSQQLLFIGVQFERKGGLQLLEAFSIVRQTFPAAQLHIVGPAALPSVPPGVVFHGNLSKADPVQSALLKSLFEQASLFVMPSLYEPFGIAPLEAMLHEIPCVVSDGWALREMVRPGLNGALVQPGSVEDLAETLRSLLADPVKLALLGRQGRAVVLPRYTWQAVAGRLAAVLENL